MGKEITLGIRKLFCKKKGTEKLEPDEEWLMEHVKSYTGDVAASKLLEDLQKEEPAFSRTHMAYLIQRCSEKNYVNAYRIGRTTKIAVIRGE